MDADLYVPAGNPRSAPVVVLVPGGGWTSADRAGLGALAASLAVAGVVVVDVTYRVAPAAFFPQPAADVVCAADFGAARAAGRGSRRRASCCSGTALAHLAAQGALAPANFRAGCPWAAKDVADVAEPLFGVICLQQPGPWREGTPTSLVGQRTPAPSVLLVHGGCDDVVPIAQSRAFGAALTAAGHDVTLEVVPTADHDTIYRPEVVSEVVVRWLTPRLSDGARDRRACRPVHRVARDMVPEPMSGGGRTAYGARRGRHPAARR